MSDHPIGSYRLTGDLAAGDLAATSPPLTATCCNGWLLLESNGCFGQKLKINGAPPGDGVPPGSSIKPLG